MCATILIMLGVNTVYYSVIDDIVEIFKDL